MVVVTPCGRTRPISKALIPTMIAGTIAATIAKIRASMPNSPEERGDVSGTAYAPVGAA